MDVRVEWKGQKVFHAQDNRGHTTIMDTPEKSGGTDLGPTPVELLLQALGGCTGMDVVTTADKMRMEIKEFEIAFETERAEDHPKKFTAITVIYKIKGDKLEGKKLYRAIDLSMNKYCSVSNSLSATTTSILELNGVIIPRQAEEEE